VSDQDSSSRDPSRPDDESAVTPQMRAAQERAEAMVRRRENPVREPDELKRPQSVLIGCVMAWVGAAVSMYGGLRSLSIDKTSSLFDDVDPDDISSQLQSYHVIGWVSIVWGLLIVLFALQAFLGARWAANALVAMAAVVLFFGLLSLISSFAPEGVGVTVWSICSATLIRLRETSRQWYTALAEARSTAPSAPGSA
jgi:hypothetical protein